MLFRSTAITIVVALAMGGAAAFLARSWLQLQTNALAAYQPAGHVVVAAEPLAYGAVVTSDSVIEIPWYTNTLPRALLPARMICSRAAAAPCSIRSSAANQCSDQGSLERASGLRLPRCLRTANAR